MTADRSLHSTVFDYLVTGQIIPHNPAAAVRGPKYVIKKGKTVVLTAAEMRQLLDSFDLTVDAYGHRARKGPADFTVAELRDRALIGVMAFSFARVSAALGMNVDDYRLQGKRSWLRLHEKGGKYHEVPVHHTAEEYLDAYVAAAGIAGERGSPLFRTLDCRGRQTARRTTSRTSKPRPRWSGWPGCRRVGVRADYAAALKRASLERQLSGVQPNTLQDILEEALGPWLRANGYVR